MNIVELHTNRVDFYINNVEISDIDRLFSQSGESTRGVEIPIIMPQNPSEELLNSIEILISILVKYAHQVGFLLHFY